MEAALFSKSSFLIAAGTIGALIVGYCIHFDRQRRKDPNYKKKLIERREANKRKCRQEEEPKFPNMNSHEDVQDYFIREVQLGESLLGRGDEVGGVEHLCNAVAVCGQPQQLLEILQHTLPPALFMSLIERLPRISQRLTEAGENTEVEDLEH